MGVIEVLFKTRNEAESIVIAEKYKLSPQREGEMIIYRINDDQRKYIESADFQKETKQMADRLAAIDRLRSAVGSGSATGQRATRSKVVRVTDEMKKTIADLKAKGETAADVQRKLEAVHGEAPGYQTVLNYYKKL